MERFSQNSALEDRLIKLDNAEKAIQDALKCAQTFLADLAKDKQSSKPVLVMITCFFQIQIKSVKV